MCTNKIVIKNPTLDYKLSDALQLQVPCGKCYECRRKKASDIETRVYNQMTWNSRNGYKNYFCTLTYDECSIARLVCDGQEVLVFDREKWRLFIQNLQKQLKREYGIGRRGVMPGINYLVCSEKGGKYGRPHHHVVFGVPDVVTPDHLHALVKRYWQGELLQDDLGNEICRGNGYVFPRYCSPSRTKKGFEIIGDPASAAKYVSKYICKDMSFFQDNQELAEYIDFYKAIKKSSDPASDEYDDADTILTELKPYMPFWTCTQNYGLHILDDLIGDNDLETVENVKRGVKIGRYSKRLQSYVYEYRPVPQYLRLKMLYDIRYIKRDDKTLVRYDLNKLGILYKQLIYDEQVQATMKFYENAYVLAKINGYDPARSIVTSEIDFKLLAVYKLTFKDRILP